MMFALLLCIYEVYMFVVILLSFSDILFISYHYYLKRIFQILFLNNVLDSNFTRMEWGIIFNMFPSGENRRSKMAELWQHTLRINNTFLHNNTMFCIVMGVNITREVLIDNQVSKCQILIYMYVWTVWRYQRGNQNP